MFKFWSGARMAPLGAPQTAATRSLGTRDTAGKPPAPGANGGGGVVAPGPDIGGQRQPELRRPRRIDWIRGDQHLGRRSSGWPPMSTPGGPTPPPPVAPDAGGLPAVSLVPRERVAAVWGAPSGAIRAPDQNLFFF